VNPELDRAFERARKINRKWAALTALNVLVLLMAMVAIAWSSAR